MEASSISTEEPPPPGSSPSPPPIIIKKPSTQQPDTPKPVPLSKGVENAKKRLRAFSIQKKTTPISPIVPKPVTTGNTTVLIGKLSSVKTTPKVEDETRKLPPKPPKPGSVKKNIQESYPDQQRRTLKEIEDMKRKMELVELGIPLGLICPTSDSEKAMPTKAMPPIKTFLGRRYQVCKAQKEQRPKRKRVKGKINSHNEAKVDEIIREAKKIRGEGKQFKFDYNKLLPDYDNPFQRKKEDQDKEYKPDRQRGNSETRRDKKSDKYDYRRHPSYRRDVVDRYKESDRYKNKDESKGSVRKDSETIEEKEADVNLKDFLVCDSWSLENDDKTSSCSPKIENKAAERRSPDKMELENKATENKVIEIKNFKTSKDPSQQLKESLSKRLDVMSEVILRSPKEKPRKIDKLQPVMDAFKYEIDEPNDDEVLDIFDEDSALEKYSVKTKSVSSYDSPQRSSTYEHDSAMDTSMDGMNDDTFLESVINEIRQDDNLCDETSQDKRLVEYDESPNKDEFDSPAQKNVKTSSRGSVTPEMDDRMRAQTKQKRDNLSKKESLKGNDYSHRKGNGSRNSEYSDGRRSTESGYKTSDTTESNPKYVESFRLSVERELDAALERSSMTKSTMESLETWSFVLKICQPLLFRHDKNKCYRETRTAPKLWFTENPKTCTCVKDRAVVYQELEMLKMALVDRVYGCDQIPDAPSVSGRAWYPASRAWLAEARVQPAASEWEADDSQPAARTPQRTDDLMLHREYQRFMEAVWPEVAEAKAPETSRSTTPIQQESKQKKKEDKMETEAEDRKVKKMKLSSEGWSQESDIEEEVKSKKLKINKSKGKSRKRKRSMSSASTISESDSSDKKKRKLLKKKALKKAKSKEAKRRRIGKKLLKKLKEKQKQKKKAEKDTSEDIEIQEKKKELKKRKKKKQQKLKKKNQKRKKKESSSSTDSSSSTSSSNSESDIKSKKRKRSTDRSKRQKRKKFSSESEELFDVNILNNIKTERLTDDEKGQKLLEFSPRVHHKLREIINVKELQNDFVGNNNILIKKEAEELPKESVEQKKNKESQEVSEAQKEIEKPQKVIELEKEIENDAEDKSVADSEDNSVNLDTMIVSPPLPVDPPTPSETEKVEFKEPQDILTSGASIAVIDESNLSQCSSQESVCSVKETSSYEKDESHLRPSSQNSNYSFNDVIASQSGLYQKGIESIVDNQDKYAEGYEQEAGNYEMYEQLAMAYQSDVASQASTSQDGGEASGSGAGACPQRIETVVRVRARGEIKCDWRAEPHPAPRADPRTDPRAAPRTDPPPQRPSRWGLKPSEVNIVLTGGEQYIQAGSPQPVYKIQSLANRTDAPTDYDEAYMDMYGASDRLQYGDCFSTDTMNIDDMNMTNMANMAGMANMANIATIASMVSMAPAQTNFSNEASVPNASPAVKQSTAKDSRSTLDARIDKALRETVLGEVAKDIDPVDEQKDVPEKGILLTGNVAVVEPGRGVKRVSFADGYKPGQDSDVEEPPIKKRRRRRRVGCAWPCPASHADHVPLWDALPPPPPPPGDPPLHCRRQLNTRTDSGIPLGGFMPPEPPPGLISF